MGASMIGLLVLLLVAAPERFASERELLERFARAQAKVERFRAEFRQERRSALSRKPLLSSGALYFRRDLKCLLFRTEKPIRVDLRIDETSYQVYRPRTKKAERFIFHGPSPGRTLLQVFGARILELRAAFEIVGASREEDLVKIALRPRSKDLRRSLPLLELHLHNKSATLRAVHYSNRDGETVTIRIGAIDSDAKVKRELFRKDPPKGTSLRVIEVKAN